MKLSPDDPKLTAYALGELDAAERAAIEAALASSPEARAAVEEIRATAGRLTSELAAEPCPELTPAQRAALESPATAKVLPFPWRRVWRMAGLAAAACAVGLGVVAMLGRKDAASPATTALAPTMHTQNQHPPLIAQPDKSSGHPDAKVVATVALSEREKILKKLDTIILPNIGFEYTPLMDALKELTQQVKQLDPDHQGVTLNLAGQPALFSESDLAATSVRISPPLADVTLRQALDVIVTVADRPVAYSVQDGGIVFSASTSPAPKPAAQPALVLSSPRQKVSQKLDSIRLPEIRYDSLPIGQVVDSLRLQAKSADAERKGVNLIISTSANPGGVDLSAVTIHIDPALNGVTLHQALDAIVKAADQPIKFSVEDYGVLLSSAATSPPVAMAPINYPSTGLPVSTSEQTAALHPGNPSSGVYSVNSVGVQGLGGQGGVDFIGSSGQERSNARRDMRGEYASVSVASGGARLQSRVWSNPDNISHAEFTPDGRRIITATDEKTVRIWDAQTGQPLSQPITTYASFVENVFVPVYQEPLSTFSIDVDTASYANVRRFLNSGRLPPRDAVRIEELVNYFSYAYPAPRGEDPFSASIETAGCPWAPEHRLVRVALRGRELPRGKRPPSNFVFLIDVSGSMQPPERLPLLKQALRALVKKMGEGDRVAIVVYASEAGVKLESTSCTEKEKILAIIDALEAGGSTNGGEGIQQAYTMARKNFIQGGVNRVLLCTDGDFNVGITDQNALVALVKENAATGVFLTTLGVGTDNYKDALMQRLADRANGNYHYLDTLEEANKVLVEQMNANLVTIAKDVKIQVEFNPAQVSAYRLIGYEKRMLRAQDFNNDRKDAGEIGAGHTVTAFYEILPAGKADLRPVVDRLKYQSAVAPASYSEKGEQSKELLTLKLRYKQPDGETSKLIEFPHTDSGGSYGKASADFKFAASVASFGMILRGSEHKGSATFDTVLELAEEGKGADEAGWRAEFINLVKKAKGLRE